MKQPPKSHSDWDRLRDGSLDAAGLRRLLGEPPPQPDPADGERLAAALQAELAGAGPADEPDFETLAAYVDGTLDDVAREILETRLGDDPALRAEVAELRVLREQLAARPVARILSFPARIALPLSGLTAAAALLLALLVTWRPVAVAPSPFQAHLSTPLPVAAERLRLTDGAVAVVLRADGSLEGLPGLPPEAARSVAEALGEGRLALPARLSGLQGQAGVLMGAPAPAAHLRVLSPRGVSVRAARPEFRWQPLAGARAHVVSVYSEDLAPVLRSPELPGAASTWRAAADLPRGRAYVWQVAALAGDERQVAPAPPEPEARFHVLAADEARRLEQELGAAGESRLARGVLLARAGVLDEAEQALAELQARNPGSPEVARLLEQLRRR
jgi:hypothetical protein